MYLIVSDLNIIKTVFYFTWIINKLKWNENWNRQRKKAWTQKNTQFCFTCTPKLNNLKKKKHAPQARWHAWNLKNQYVRFLWCSYFLLLPTLSGTQQRKWKNKRWRPQFIIFFLIRSHKDSNWTNIRFWAIYLSLLLKEY